MFVQQFSTENQYSKQSPLYFAGEFLGVVFIYKILRFVASVLSGTRFSVRLFENVFTGSVSMTALTWSAGRAPGAFQHSDSSALACFSGAVLQRSAYLFIYFLLERHMEECCLLKQNQVRSYGVILPSLHQQSHKGCTFLFE